MDKKFEAWAWKILRKYQKILLLSDHDVQFEYKDRMEQGVMMTHGMNYPYKVTCIRYGDLALKYWNNKRKRELHDCLIHELCHSITDPLYAVAVERYTTIDQINNERERLTDHIANVITFLYR